MTEKDRGPRDPPPSSACPPAGEAARHLEQAQCAKSHSPGGHGIAAEDANALSDRMQRRRVRLPSPAAAGRGAVAGEERLDPLQRAGDDVLLGRSRSREHRAVERLADDEIGELGGGAPAVRHP